MRTSVVIVGAGPGGAAAAIGLAQRGIRDVVLLDKDTFPRDKTCGSGLSPNALTLLDGLGVGPAVRRAGYPITGLRLTTPGGRVMRLVSDATEAAVILLRKDFDNLLVERAKELGVTFVPDFHARELLHEGGRTAGVRGKDGREVRADYVLCADGAHSIFSRDPRPRRTISTLMGWWEGFSYEPSTLEMIFDKNLAPLYGWMFPETADRVNIGICMEGEDAGGAKTSRNVRDVFQRFLDDHFADRLRTARQIGRLKGHPISYTTWIGHTHAPGVVFLGEAARITHNATGEGIFQAMQSGLYAAEAMGRVLHGEAPEAQAMRDYTWALRRRFTASFLVGHAVRAMVETPLLDGIARLYNSPEVRGVVTRLVGSALAGSSVASRTGADVDATGRRSEAGGAAMGAGAAAV
jgi:geranylgeranyl reductase family protein